MAKNDNNTASAPAKKNDTGVFQHGCENPGQDKLYGKGNRLFNYAVGKNAWRCTCCKGVR